MAANNHIYAHTFRVRQENITPPDPENKPSFPIRHLASTVSHSLYTEFLISKGSYTDDNKHVTTELGMSALDLSLLLNCQDGFDFRPLV